jgi:hypothetical protein
MDISVRQVAGYDRNLPGLSLHPADKTRNLLVDNPADRGSFRASTGRCFQPGFFLDFISHV